LGERGTLARVSLQLLQIRTLMEILVGRLREARDDDRGMTTETVIITAALAALALAVTIIIVTKVTNKAESIPTD
jgi:hypothetical protein